MEQQNHTIESLELCYSEAQYRLAKRELAMTVNIPVQERSAACMIVASVESSTAST